jgi:hypothetical protein
MSIPFVHQQLHHVVNLLLLVLLLHGAQSQYPMMEDAEETVALVWQLRKDLVVQNMTIVVPARHIVEKVANRYMVSAAIMPAL